MSIGAEIVYILLFAALYFQVFMLVSFIEAARGRRRNPGVIRSPQSDLITPGFPFLPSVAIVVPCFNEERTVAATIESLMALKYPHDKLEIIVVDDGSTDGTFATAQRCASAHAHERGGVSDIATVRAQHGSFFSINSQSNAGQIAKRDTGEFRNVGNAAPFVRVYHKENGGKHTAMNYALARTQADLIGCLDADSVVAPDALARIAPLFADGRVAAVTPGILIKKPGNALQHMQHAEYSLSLFNRFTLAALGSMFITPGPFSIFRTAVVRAAGGWRHGHSTEDLEMALRIQEMGHLIANAPAASVYTGTPATLRALVRQRVRWTYGFLRNAVDYRHMFGSRRYGNLGLFILPMALASIGIAIFFAFRILWLGAAWLADAFARYELGGLSFAAPSFDIFYFNTSMMWFLIYTAVALVVVLIAVGAQLGTGSSKLPKGTPLFVAFYSFLVPVWLSAAVVRALFKTGVKWR